MIFFISTIFICLIVFALFRVYQLYQRIGFGRFYQITLRSIVQKQFKISSDRYFSSYAIAKAIKILRKKREKTALVYLSFARISKAVEILNAEKHEDIAISLIAHFDFKKALKAFETLIIKQPSNMFILGEMAELYYLTNDYKKFQMTTEKIDTSKSNHYTAAKKLYLEIILNMQDGDLLPASDDGNKVIKMFNNNKAHIEEAKTYLLVGIMYKACAIFDPAQFMLETALKIFTKYDDKIGIIETYGTLAMLMSAQERFNEAESYLEKASSVSEGSESDAYILNQRGLTLFLKNNFEDALKILKTISPESTSKALAFNNEIISYIKHEQKDYKETIKYAKQAADAYQKLDNLSAVLESEYLQAVAYLELNNTEEAEEITRNIIYVAKKQPTSFHVANAYNLLGLIFINRGEFGRAKSLFKESLGFEQRNNRIAGIATDYYNIGLLETKIGQIEQAAISLENALEFASMLGENPLSETIKQRIKNLPQTK